MPTMTYDHKSDCYTENEGWNIALLCAISDGFKRDRWFCIRGNLDWDDGIYTLKKLADVPCDQNVISKDPGYFFLDFKFTRDHLYNCVFTK